MNPLLCQLSYAAKMPGGKYSADRRDSKRLKIPVNSIA
jgi:hypothetical protein